MGNVNGKDSDNRGVGTENVVELVAQCDKTLNCGSPYPLLNSAGSRTQKRKKNKRRDSTGTRILEREGEDWRRG